MKKSHLIAVGFAGVIMLWMGAGMIFGNAGKRQVAATDNAAQKPIQGMVVEVREQKAAPIISYIIAQGHVMPDREVTVRSEIAAQVKQILIEEGQTVKAGDVISLLDMADRQIRQEKANAKTAEGNHKYLSAKTLGEKGYTSVSGIDEAFAALKAAQAEEKQISLEIENTKIKAPFDGIIDQQNIEEGDYVSVGDEMFTIVDNDPLVVTVYVPQHEIGAIKIGGTAEIKLATGQNKEGAIRFIAPRAEKATRTFRVEIKTSNSDNLPSGISATVRIPKQSIMAHFVSPALLTLDEKGTTGIKTVNEENLVGFYTIKIVSAKQDGIYVKGLPEQIKIITNGQGFVRTGETVSFVMASEEKRGAVESD